MKALLLLLPLLFSLPALGQDSGPEGIGMLAYAQGMAVVLESQPLPDFLGYGVEYVEGRTLGTTDRYGSLRFTRVPEQTGFNTQGYVASGAIGVNQFAAAASQLQLIVDELLGTTPEHATTFAFRADEGFGVTGAYEDGAWRLGITLDAYGQQTPTAMTPAHLTELIALVRTAQRMAAE